MSLRHVRSVCAEVLREFCLRYMFVAHSSTRETSLAKLWTKIIALMRLPYPLSCEQEMIWSQLQVAAVFLYNVTIGCTFCTFLWASLQLNFVHR